MVLQVEEVTDHEIGWPSSGKLDSPLPISGLAHAVAVVLEVDGENPTGVRVRIHDKDVVQHRFRVWGDQPGDHAK